MKKISKKEIHVKVKEAMNAALEQLDIAPATKKTRKLVSKVSRKISIQLNQQVKKRLKKEEKLARRAENGKVANKGRIEFAKVG